MRVWLPYFGTNDSLEDGPRQPQTTLCPTRQNIPIVRTKYCVSFLILLTTSNLFEATECASECYPITRRDVESKHEGDIYNLTIVNVADKRSRLVGVNKYFTMCEWDYYIESPHKCFGGADRWISYINKVDNETKSTPDQVLFTVEAAKAFQGSAFYWFGKGKHDVEVMNSGNHPLDVFVVSNDEIDDGLEHMLVWMEWLDSSTDIILSNVNWTGSVLEGSRLKRWAVRERRGLQVGFVAYIREDIHVVVSGLDPETFVVNPLGLGTAVELNKAVIEMMACHPGVSAIVMIGRSRQKLFTNYLKTMDRVTMAVNGEPYTTLVTSDEVTVPHEVPSIYDNQDVRVYSQTTRLGTGVAHMWATVNTTTKKKVEWGGRHIILDDTVAPSDPATFKMLEELSVTVSELLDTEHVGNISSDVYGEQGLPYDNSTWPGCRAHDCPMGRAVNEAMLASCRLQLRDSPCDFSLTNGGGIRNSFVYDPQTNGAITMRDVMEVLPFQNNMVMVRIQGMHITTMLQRMIWRLMEVEASVNGWPGSFAQVAGLRYVYNPMAETEMDTIVLVQVYKDGEWGPLYPNNFYRVATNNYLAGGGDGYTEFRDFGLDSYSGQNQETVLVNYIRLSQPNYFETESREALLECIGLNRYVVAGGDGDLNAWPEEASHCNIIQAQRTVLLVCGAGEYHKMEGALQECLPCPIGTASAEGDNLYADNQTCTPCAAGTFSGKLGSLECIPCDSVEHLKGAYFQAKEGQGSCDACPAGTSRRLGTPGTSVHECLCLENYFQPDGKESGAECVPCVVGGVCEGVSSVTQKNALPYPKPGFWADPGFRTQFYECDENRCKGGLDFACDTGFDVDMGTNRMCNRVAKGYAQYGGYLVACANGYQSTESWVVSVFVIFGVCLSFVLLNGWLCDFVSMDVLFKNVRLLAITSSFKLNWHPSLRGVFVFFRFALFDVDVMQPNCIMPWSFEESFFLQLVLPIMLGLVYFIRPLIFFVRQQFKQRLPWDELDDKKFHQPFNHAVASMCSTMLTCYPSLITVLLSSLSCEKDASGDAFLVVAPNLKCWSSQHTKFLVCAGLGVPVVIVLPVWMAYTLLRNLRRDTLYKETTLQRFGFLYRNYDTEYLYWESVFMTKVLVLVAIQVFLHAEPVLQMFIALLIHLVALTAHAFTCPYASKLADLAECVMLCVVCIFTASGMLFYTPSVSQSTQDGLSVFLLTLFAVTAALVLRVFVIDATESSSNVMVAKSLKKQITAAAQLADPKQTYKSERFARAVKFHNEHLKGRSSSIIVSLADEGGASRFKSAATEVQVSLDSEDKPAGVLAALIRSRKIVQLQSQLAQDVGVNELHHTIVCKYFLQWVHSHQLSVDDADKILYLDDLMAPYIGDQAVTSHLVQSAKAGFWRNVLLAFPHLIDFSQTASQSEINELRSILEKLATMADSGEGDLRRKNFADFICDEDLASVGYWVLHAQAEEREAFLSLVEKVANANKFVMGVHVNCETGIQRIEDAEGRDSIRDSVCSHRSSTNITQIEKRIPSSTSIVQDALNKATSFKNRIDDTLRGGRSFKERQDSKGKHGDVSVHKQARFLKLLEV